MPSLTKCVGESQLRVGDDGRQLAGTPSPSVGNISLDSDDISWPRAGSAPRIDLVGKRIDPVDALTRMANLLHRWPGNGLFAGWSAE